MMKRDKLNIMYLRLSKEDGDEETGGITESCSILSQRSCIRQYIQAHPDVEGEYEELVDDGYTGTHFDRPAMTRLLGLVETGMVGTLIVRDLSRFGRNYLETGHLLEYVFPAFDVRFISINEKFDSDKLDGETGGFHLAIYNLVNQLYSHDISRKIKSAVDMKKRNGEFVYGTAPYGYKKGEVRNTIVIDDQVAHHVRDIFNWAANGVTVTQIARRLNEAGVQTPSEYLETVRGNYKTRPHWGYESIRNILLNRIYTGDTVPFKSHVIRVGSNRVKMIPEENQIVIEDTHAPLVSREAYTKAREVVKSNQKSKPSAPPILLATYLVCGHCGNRLQKGRHTNKRFKCATARYLDSPCKEVIANEAQIEAIVLRAIQKQCEVLNVKLQQKKKARIHLQSEGAVLRQELEELSRRIRTVQERSMELYEQFISSDISKEQYVSEKAEAKNQENQLNIQRRAIQEKLSALPQKQMTLEDDAVDLLPVSQYDSVDRLTPDLIKTLVKQIIVFPSGDISIQWNFRDSLLS